jgi:hypothetical protein
VAKIRNDAAVNEDLDPVLLIERLKEENRVLREAEGLEGGGTGKGAMAPLGHVEEDEMRAKVLDYVMGGGGGGRAALKLGKGKQYSKMQFCFAMLRTMARGQGQQMQGGNQDAAASVAIESAGGKAAAAAAAAAAGAGAGAGAGGGLAGGMAGAEVEAMRDEVRDLRARLAWSEDALGVMGRSAFADMIRATDSVASVASVASSVASSSGSSTATNSDKPEDKPEDKLGSSSDTRKMWQHFIRSYGSGGGGGGGSGGSGGSGGGGGGGGSGSERGSNGVDGGHREGESNREVYRRKAAEAKAQAVQVNDARDAIVRLKADLEKGRVRQMMGRLLHEPGQEEEEEEEQWEWGQKQDAREQAGAGDAGGAGGAVGPAEASIMQQIDEAKLQYREGYKRLGALKIEVHAVKRMVEREQKQAGLDFALWQRVVQQASSGGRVSAAASSSSSQFSLNAPEEAVPPAPPPPAPPAPSASLSQQTSSAAPPAPPGGGRRRRSRSSGIGLGSSSSISSSISSSSSVDRSILEDHAKAIAHFQAEVPEGRAAWLKVSAGKSALRSQYDGAKEMAEVVSQARERVLRLKGECAEEGAGEEEVVMLAREKQEYKSGYQELKTLKAGINATQEKLREAQAMFQQKFERWCMQLEASSQTGGRAGTRA